MRPRIWLTALALGALGAFASGSDASEPSADSEVSPQPDGGFPAAIVPGDAGSTCPGGCDAQNPCNTYSCDLKHRCLHVALADASPCGTNRYCHSGVCSDCIPGNACTLPVPRPCHVGVESCATGVPLCTDQNALAATLCDDGNPCTSADRCDAFGNCAGAPYSCPASGGCQSSSTCEGNGSCSIVNEAKGVPCTGTSPCDSYACDGEGDCVGTSLPGRTLCWSWR